MSIGHVCSGTVQNVGPAKNLHRGINQKVAQNTVNQCQTVDLDKTVHYVTVFSGRLEQECIFVIDCSRDSYNGCTC